MSKVGRQRLYKMLDPLVSVCIPVYNRQKTVTRALDSALAQTYKNLEIISVDNASSDGTFAVLERYQFNHPNVRVFRNETNIGPVANWLKCIAHCRGSLVKILFSDDWLLPNAIETFVDGFRRHESAAFITSMIGFSITGNFFPDLYSRGNSGRVSTREFLWEQATKKEHIVSPSAAMFRREDVANFVHLEICGPDEAYCNFRGMGNDLMLFLQACDARESLFHVEERLVIFSDSDEEESISKSAIESGLGARKFFCYRNAFSRFLESSVRSSFERAELRCAMFLRDATFRSIIDSHSRRELFARLAPFGSALLAFVKSKRLANLVGLRLLEKAGSIFKS